LKIIKEAINFAKHLAENWYLIFELTRRDFKQKYVTNVFGFAWAILDPLALMVIFWIVFGLGLRGGRDMEIPFVTYLITGLVAYQCFQTILTQATGSIKGYSFLLNKVNFGTSIIPLVKIFSEYFLHGIVVLVMIVILLLNGIFPTLYWLQFFYYAFAMGILLIGLSWFASAVNLFFPDIGKLIPIVLRFFFFLTPIIWSIDMFPPRIHWVFKLNPLYYIVMGYRDSFIYGRGFWEEPLLGLYFWSVSAVALLVGVAVFIKLKPHFADVV